MSTKTLHLMKKEGGARELEDHAHLHKHTTITVTKSVSVLVGECNVYTYRILGTCVYHIQDTGYMCVSHTGYWVHVCITYRILGTCVYICVSVLVGECNVHTYRILGTCVYICAHAYVIGTRLLCGDD